MLDAKDVLLDATEYKYCTCHTSSEHEVLEGHCNNTVVRFGFVICIDL